MNATPYAVSFNLAGVAGSLNFRKGTICLSLDTSADILLSEYMRVPSHGLVFILVKPVAT